MRFIGVTGHGLRIAAMHRRSLERFDFDSVLLPYNSAMLARHRATAPDFEALLAICRKRDVAVQTIKVDRARRRWADRRPGTSATWYEPLTSPADIDRAVHWVLAPARHLPQHRQRPRLLRPRCAPRRATRPPAATPRSAPCPPSSRSSYAASRADAVGFRSSRRPRERRLRSPVRWPGSSVGRAPH